MRDRNKVKLTLKGAGMNHAWQQFVEGQETNWKSQAKAKAKARRKKEKANKKKRR